jgi:hypothetical protein
LLRRFEEEGVATRFGALASSPPDPNGLLTLFTDYYCGSNSLAAERRRREGVILHRPGNDRSVSRFLAELMLAAPELGWLDVVERQGAGATLRAESHAVELLGSEKEIIDTEDGRYVRRLISTRVLVSGANALLDRIGESRRFIPICGVTEVEAYVLLDRERAEALSYVDVLAAPLDRLLPFAGWPTDEWANPNRRHGLLRRRAS